MKSTDDTMTYPSIYRALLGVALFATVAGSAQEAKPMEVYTNDSAEWIPLYGETWWDYYHPDWVGLFPGGRSNRFNEQ